MFEPLYEGEIHYLLNGIPYCSLEQAVMDANGQTIKVFEYHKQISKDSNGNHEYLEFRLLSLWNNPF